MLGGARRLSNSKMKRILVTGGSGLLGPFLMAESELNGRVFSLARSRGTFLCDLTSVDQVAAALTRVKPDLIIHAAALTDVDFCEAHRQEAYEINATATKTISAMADPACKIVYISTDQVYPDSVGPHLESNTGPVNVYGKTKLIGEQAVLERSNSLVIRTSFLCKSQNDRAGLLDFFLSALAENREIKIFRDVFFSPIGAHSLAKIIFELITLEANGVFNVGSREGQSKAELFNQIASVVALYKPRARTVDSTSIPFRAPRCLDLRMNVCKVEKKLGRKMKGLEQELREILNA